MWLCQKHQLEASRALGQPRLLQLNARDPHRPRPSWRLKVWDPGVGRASSSRGLSFGGWMAVFCLCPHTVVPLCPYLPGVPLCVSEFPLLVTPVTREWALPYLI